MLPFPHKRVKLRVLHREQRRIKARECGLPKPCASELPPIRLAGGPGISPNVRLTRVGVERLGLQGWDCRVRVKVG